jgi:hypothetical protein
LTSVGSIDPDGGRTASLIHHGDAWSQYLSYDYTQTLKDHGVLASIGTVGDSLDYDNARPSREVEYLRIALSDRVSWNDDGQHSEGIAYDVSIDLGYRVIDHEGHFQYLPLATARSGNVSIDETDPEPWACDAERASEFMGASDYWAPRSHTSTRGLILQ